VPGIISVAGLAEITPILQFFLPKKFDILPECDILPVTNSKIWNFMNNTLNNGFMLLEYLAGTAEPMGVKQLAEHFSLPQSHVCRLLKSLRETGYVEQFPGSRKYRVSLRILTLANARLQKVRLLNLARPYIRQLAEKLDMPVFVTREFHGHSVIVGTEYPAFFPGDAGLIIGVVHRATDSACGKICAAYCKAEDRQTILEQTDWDAPGDFQGRRADYEAELAAVRKRGFARRDLPEDLGAFGVPLLNPDGSIEGALGVMMPKERKRTPELWQKVEESAVVCRKMSEVLL